MPAKDKIHNVIKNALIKEGWKVTDDPYIIEYKELLLFADLGAEHPIAAKREEQTIVVEAKSFIGPSFAKDLENAVGQYLVYLALLEITTPERQLYLAISSFAYHKFFQQEAVKVIVKRYHIALLIVDIETEEIVTWKN